MLWESLNVCVVASLPVRSLLPGLTCEEAALLSCFLPSCLECAVSPPNKETLNPSSLKWFLVVRYLVTVMRSVREEAQQGGALSMKVDELSSVLEPT